MRLFIDDEPKASAPGVLHLRKKSIAVSLVTT